MKRALLIMLSLLSTSAVAVTLQVVSETPEQVYQNCMNEAHSSAPYCSCLSQDAKRTHFDSSKMYVIEMSPGIGNGDIQQPAAAEQQQAIAQWNQMQAQCRANPDSVPTQVGTPTT
jgi:hypothetical protein